MDKVDYEGKAVLLTGASSGLGKAMALAFASAGAFVGMIARRGDRLERLESDIRAFGGEAMALPADVADAAALSDVFLRFMEQAGRLDVLVNNAGTGVFGKIPSDEEYRRIYEVNVHSVYRLSLMALPDLEKTKGAILNVGSAVTERPFAGEFVYSATKGAVTAMTRSMAATFGKSGVRVNLLQPGVIASEFNVAAGIPPEIDRMAHEGSRQWNALDATGEPSDAAQAALFLCSERARFITGEILKVDGGLTLAGIRV